MIKIKAPWYFEVRGLISERPNIVPTGLGNSTTAVDMTNIMGEGDSSEADIRDGKGDLSDGDLPPTFASLEEEDTQASSPTSEGLADDISQNDELQDDKSSPP